MLVLTSILSYLYSVHNCYLYECIRVEWWLVAIGFSVLIFCYDEARKFIIRKCPGGNVTGQFSLIHVLFP